MSSIQQAGKYANTREFYDYLLNRIVVRFSPRTSQIPEGEIFDVPLSKKMSYDQFSAKVGEHLKVDPTHIRFSTTSATTLKPKSIIRKNANQNLYQILHPQFSSYSSHQRSDMLFYEVMDMSLSELETKKTMRLTWVSEGLSKEVRGPYRVVCLFPDCFIGNS